MLTPLMNYLDNENVKYTIIIHSPAYEAEAIATSVHMPAKELAKTVIVKLDGILAMAVVPASCRVDLPVLQGVAKARTAELASEEEFRGRFPDCETGAMPPFGNLYDMPVLVDERIARTDHIAFNATTHRHLIRMSWDDFNRLVKPRILRLSRVLYAA